MKHHIITPVAKPRMTQRDKWMKRPAVVKYFAFKDECREKGVSLKDESYVCFIIPFPKSMKKAERQELLYRPHQQKPDLDNLLKALMDAVLDEDSHISHVQVKKIWGERGEIIIGSIRG
jgi:Holliday junction resolvase RusA-like endonuclease